MKAKLDRTDWRILAALQQDGRITNKALAERIGLSAPPCLRRLRSLEEAGVIARYTAVLDAEALGFELTAFAMVGLHSQADADLAAFEAQVREWDIVRECHMLSGEVDFVLKCVARNLTGFNSFVQQLTGAANVASVKTAVTLRCAKSEPGPPLSDAAV